MHGEFEKSLLNSISFVFVPSETLIQMGDLSNVEFFIITLKV